MSKIQNSNLRVSKSDFQQLKARNKISTLMQAKLQYLLAKIEQRPASSFLFHAYQQYEKNSIDQISIDVGISLFCNIVNCLSGKEVVEYFRNQKAYLKKNHLFAMWKQVHITCDSNNMEIRKKPGEKSIENLELVNCRVSKEFFSQKKKHVFRIKQCNKVNFLIGFDLESTCSQIHGQLKEIIRGKVQQLTDTSDKKQSKNSSSDDKQQGIEEFEIAMEEETGNNVLIQFIKQKQMNDDKMYKLVKAQSNIRQMINTNYINRLKTQILLPKPKITASILDYYTKLNQWNSEIEKCTLITKLSDNSYLLEIRVKPYNYLSWARSTVLLVTALIYQNSYFLILRSTGQDTSDNDTVKMEWNQLIQINEKEERVLMTISSQFDFKGNSSFEDSQKMGLKFLKHLSLFCKFFEAKEISFKTPVLFKLPFIQQKNQSQKLIPKSVYFDKPMNNSSLSSLNQTIYQKDENPQGNRINIYNSQGELNDKQSQLQTTQINQRDQEVTISKSLMFTNLFSENNNQCLTSYMIKNDGSEITMKLAELIRKGVHHSYYLNKKFNQQVNLEVYKNEHTVSDHNHYIYQNGNWKINEEKDLVFVNQKVMDIQKKVVILIMKKISSSILSGKSIMNMSLPVQIFDHMSLLQRIAIGFGYAPKFLVSASNTSDLIEQAKQVTLFVLGIAPLHITLSKPFNPILGETFECRIGGIPLYLEQISHHPPISAFFMKTQKFTFHGAFNSHAEIGINRVSGRNLAPLFLEFHNTHTCYQIKLPQMEVSGLLHGDKKYRALGKGFIYQKTHNRFVQWSIGKDKKSVYEAEGKIKPNNIYGGLFTASKIFVRRFQECQNKQKFDGIQANDIIQTHVKISGHWCLDVFFNSQKVKSMEYPLPNQITYPQYTLPSDSNFRLDVIYKRMQNLKSSNQQKQILENIQRHDKKLRQGLIRQI